METMFISAIRVVFVCPYGKGVLYRAANRIIASLLSEPTSQVTYSSDASTIFSSYFWDQRWKKEDHIIVIFVDIPVRSLDDIRLILINLRDQINTEFARSGVNHPKKSVWITAYPIYILSA